jgi:hypothetical protein
LTTLGNGLTARNSHRVYGQKPDADNRRRDGARATEFTAVSISRRIALTFEHRQRMAKPSMS